MPACEDTTAGSASVSHLLDDRCHVSPDPISSEVHANWAAHSELLRAVRWKGSAKALWKVADGEQDLPCWLECRTWSFVECFMPVSVSIGCKMQPKQNGDRLHPPFTNIVPESMSRRWNSGPIFQQVICLELYPICLLYIQQIFGSDTGYTWKIYSVKFFISSSSWGACSAVGLTMVTGTFCIAPSK